MKRKISFAALLIVTLFIGFAIGFLVSGRMISSKVQDMRSFYTPSGFNSQLIRILHPTPEQLKMVEPILDKYAKLNHDLLLDSKSDQHDLFNEMKEEIEPFLDADQIEKLNNLPKNRFLKNQQEPANNRKHRNGPNGQGKHRRRTVE